MPPVWVIARRHLACMAWLAALAAADPAGAQTPRGVASLIIDLKSGATLSAEQPDIVRRAVLPGSVAKIAAIAAALEQGTISPRSTITCTRTVVVDGHRLTCTHPDLHRPLTPAEALTHSCNVYVATVTARLPRAALDRALGNLGLPPSGTASVQAASLGLEGPRAPARQWITALARIAGSGPTLPWQTTTLEVVRQGLRGAAADGTASALGQAGVDALAKTGTVDAGGVSQGLVVGVTPSDKPTVGFAVLVAGGAGMDAARVAAARLTARTQVGQADHATAGDAAEPATAPARPRIKVGVAQRDGRYLVREMDLDDYVAGVIAGEQANAGPPAAADALAIAARTYALANRGRHAAEGFDLCDLTHCQVLRASTAASRAAARRTASQYLADKGEPAEVFYTAACGGHTERPSAVWRGAIDPPYLPALEDDACRGEPAWTSSIHARDLLRALHAGGFSGESVRSLTVTSRSSSGRVAWLRADGITPPEISGENLRTLVGRVVGWQMLRSTLFDVRRTASGYEFHGHGAGHGVGLCVLGATARAKRGDRLPDILRTYYPGLELRTLGATPADSTSNAFRLRLPVEDEAARPLLERQIVAALEAVRARLGAGSRATLTLRFHPTVESYQRSSGSGWFTAATTMDGTIEFLPVNVLRSRGILESTLRHELAHALTREALRGAPRWLHEGVAAWAARGSHAAAQDGPTPAACPADGEFARAASAGVLERLYERSVACYERELRQGRSWKTFVH